MIIERKPTEKEYLAEVGEKVRDERIRQRYTLTDMATAIGYSSGSGITSLSAIEKGEVATLDIVMIKRIAEFLQIPIIELID